MKLSIIVPIYNESKTLQVLHERLMSVLPDITSDFEIILVNDGSSDDSLDQIRQLADENEKLKWVNFSRNFGHQAAISAGISHASGDALVTMDGDLQDPPELIPQLVEEWQAGYDVIYARRSRRKGEFWGKKVAAFLFYRMLKKITPVDIPKDVGDFRLIDKKVAQHLIQMPEPQRFLRGQIAWMGFSSSFVDFEREERYAGESKYTLRKLIQLALNGIWGFSKLPITMLWFFTLILCAVTIGLFIWGWINDFDSSISILLPLLFLVLSGNAGAIALLGEYMYRVFDASRNRPAYIVKDTNL
jgi:dolichol-phosphate mannosyltransferase